MSVRESVAWLDLDRIADSGQCFRWEKAPDGAWRIPADGRVLTARSDGGALCADCDGSAFTGCWSDFFDLKCDYGAYLAQIDPKDAYLRAAAAASEGIRILRQPLWEMIASALISQNNNIPRIRAILSRLCGGGDAFPRAEAVAAMGEKELREMGLGYRARYLAETARRFRAEGEAVGLEQLPNKEARAYLCSYSGIGPKVADCVCLFALGHKAAFPRDVWIKRVEDAYYAGHFPEERYPDCAGVMQQFMFYYERTRPRAATAAAPSPVNSAL